MLGVCQPRKQDVTGYGKYGFGLHKGTRILGWSEAASTGLTLAHGQSRMPKRRQPGHRFQPSHSPLGISSRPGANRDLGNLAHVTGRRHRDAGRRKSCWGAGAQPWSLP